MTDPKPALDLEALKSLAQSEMRPGGRPYEDAAQEWARQFPATFLALIELAEAQADRPAFDLEALAAALWKADAVDVGAPAMIAEGRTPQSFAEQNEATRAKWFKFAKVAAEAQAPRGGVEEQLRSALSGLLNFVETTLTHENIGEGMHAGLRKGSQAPDSRALWQAISNSRTTAWSDAAKFAVDPFFSMWGRKPIADAKAALAAHRPSPEALATPSREAGELEHPSPKALALGVESIRQSRMAGLDDEDTAALMFMAMNRPQQNLAAHPSRQAHETSPSPEAEREDDEAARHAEIEADKAKVLEELHGWTGSAFLAGEERGAIEEQRKAELYTFLCRLIGWFLPDEQTGPRSYARVAWAASVWRNNFGAMRKRCEELEADLAALKPPAPGCEPFQARVEPWMTETFGAEISADPVERCDRLLEEVFELLQWAGYDPARITALRDYTWSRPVGEGAQEVGGVMVTLAAFCLAHGLDMHEAGETELSRIWTKVPQIRAKHAAKPTGSALPIASPSSGISRARLAAAISEALLPRNLRAQNPAVYRFKDTLSADEIEALADAVAKLKGG